MILSIITINWNNASGLEKTLASVLKQKEQDFEHIIVDGASTDGSVERIKSYNSQRPAVWVSERDNGIYNAMNKGVRMAQGQYIMILNSGDYLASPDVVGRMYDELRSCQFPPILFGNIIKVWPNGKTTVDHQLCGDISFLDFYRGTLNPDGTLVQRSLFEKYGYFDENMRICSDWAWFMHVVGLVGMEAKHFDYNTIYFDMTGVSESGGKNRQTIESERRQTLEKALPATVLKDYDHYWSDIYLMCRIRRHPICFHFVKLMERVLFKLERIIK